MTVSAARLFETMMILLVPWDGLSSQGADFYPLFFAEVMLGRGGESNYHR